MEGRLIHLPVADTFSITNEPVKGRNVASEIVPRLQVRCSCDSPTSVRRPTVARHGLRSRGWVFRVGLCRLSVEQFESGQSNGVLEVGLGTRRGVSILKCRGKPGKV